MKIPFKETLVTGVCIAILCGLGTWQVQRLHWKDRIITDLENAYASGNHRDLAEDLMAIDSGKKDYDYGTVKGHLLKDKAILLGPRVLDGRGGYDLLIPLKTETGTVIVDTGWVSDLWNDTLEERLSTLPQDAAVRGLARRPDYSSMTSKNSPENDLWFRADPHEIASAKDITDIHDAVLYADRIDPPLQDVTAHEEKWLPRNKHLQYAIFWYAMATVMLGVYGFYVAGLNRNKKPA